MRAMDNFMEDEALSTIAIPLKHPCIIQIATIETLNTQK